MNDVGDFDWLRNWARLTPQNIAIQDADSGKSLTYLELYYLSCRVADTLSKEYGVTKGDRVAMLATNEIEAIPLFFACLRNGAIFVPVNFRLTAREVEHILEDSAAQAIVLQKNFLPIVEGVSAAVRPAHTILLEDFATNLQRELDTFRCSSREYQKVLSYKEPGWHIPLHAESGEPCMILYTSGTTGAPKGACITPKMLHWNSINTTLRLNLSQSDVFVSFLPFFHTGGWNVLLTPFLHRGARTVLTKKFDANRILELCENEGATILFGVPTTMEMMAHSPRFHMVKLAKVRYAIVGGEPMSIELIKTWQDKGVPIRQGFGLTEFGPNVFSLNETDAIRKIGSIGFPNFYINTKVVDDHGKEVGPGEIGELLLSGPVCTPGYWRNEKATKEAIVDGWFHTGDLVRFDEEGYFYVAGRKKDMFISGGENVYPVEIERVLSQLPAIREVAVIGIPDTKWGEVGCACVSLVEGKTITEHEIMSYCSNKLAKYKIPKQVKFFGDLPKGDSGKILKREIKQLIAQR